MTKLNPEGTALVYSTYLRGENDDFGFGVILDASGDAYVTGETNSITFPVTPGAFQGTFGGYFDAFVTKLSPDGTALAYSTYLGKEEYDAGRAIAVDSSKKVFVTGTTRSTNFPVTAGAFQTAHGGAGYDDAFVAKLNPNGTALEYGTYLGGGDYDSGSAIAVEGLGNASVTGGTGSSNFPVTAGAFKTTSGGYVDAFVAKLRMVSTALLCQALLQGHAAGGHAASLDVHLRPAAGGADTAVAVTSNADGTFSVTPPSPGSWHVSVKERRTLATVRTGAPGGDVLDFGTLRAGDANNDNKVNIVDFSMLATTFGKSAGDAGYDDRADFNGDGKVNIVDFSLLASNFGTTGDAWPEAEAGASGANASAPEKPAGSTGSSSGETSGCQVAPGLEAVLLALPLGLVFWKP